MKRFKAPSLSRGFTLVELLVVIAIIGVLATLVLLQLGTARARARDAKRIADVTSLRTANELFFDDNNGEYADTVGMDQLETYMSNRQIPDPPTGTGIGVGRDSYGYGYAPANPTGYHVWIELERDNVALDGDSDLDSALWASVTGGKDANDPATDEVCTSAVANNTDCIYDLGQQP